VDSRRRPHRAREPRGSGARAGGGVRWLSDEACRTRRAHRDDPEAPGRAPKGRASDVKKRASDLRFGRSRAKLRALAMKFRSLTLAVLTAVTAAAATLPASDAFARKPTTRPQPAVPRDPV